MMSTLTPFELVYKLAQIICRLRSLLSPSATYLSGSYAYGLPDAGSDVGLLVVVEDIPLHPHARDPLAIVTRIAGFGRTKLSGYIV